MGHSASENSLSEALKYFGANKHTVREWSDLQSKIVILPETLRHLAGIFCAIQSQWRWHDGRIIGLAYEGVHAYLSLSQSHLSTADFARLQRLENLCLKLFPMQNH